MIVDLVVAAGRSRGDYRIVYDVRCVVRSIQLRHG